MEINKNVMWIAGGSILALGLGAAAYFLWVKKKPTTDRFGNKVLKKKKAGGLSGGVKADQDEKGKSITEPDWKNPFDMNYEQDVKQWLSPKRISVLQNGQVMAEAIYKAKGSGWWSDDDEEVVKAVFQKQLRDKVQLAGLSRAFWNKYQKDLWEFLNSFLSDSEMERYVRKPVSALPDYQII